jgi:diaminohydroxyphosphoribosylaminopyrimidine deaminase/5-amino-6-(5-phosphoribosylamino)uracil reductase|tara:strand:- start:1907 stop:3001 length:1095 start_codon:yes stop_codon:yes gene_type:complete
MASPKKNYSYDQLNYSRLAFEQAKINVGSTGKNPSVGCVAVKNNSVISSGKTSVKGRPHAEFNCLNKNINFVGADLFITLEPCTHKGMTPPCTNIIIKKKIKRVFFSIFDLDKRSSYKAVKILKKENISASVGIFKKYGNFFYKSYFLKHTKKIPLIDAKIAISKDYFTKNKNSKWITNKHSIKRVHLLRSKYDCIVTTSKSINDDNSILNCRIKGLENLSPSIIIIDRNLNIKKNSKIFYLNKKNNIYLLTTSNNKKKEALLKERKVKVLKMKSMSSKEDFDKIFKKLYKLGFYRVFVETGLTFLTYLLKNNFIDNLYTFKSTTTLKNNGYNFTDNIFLKKIILKNKINVNLYGDILYKNKLK